MARQPGPAVGPEPPHHVPDQHRGHDNDKHGQQPYARECGSSRRSAMLKSGRWKHSCDPLAQLYTAPRLLMRVSTLLILLATVCASGCGVHRSLTIKSDPAGALVYLNGLEVGRTPVTRDFLWY